jgi:hypothetical protein
MNMSCSSYDNSTASPAVILSSAGTVVYRARAGSVFGMPWNALVGTHTIVNGSTDLSSLCALDGTSWDGKVVLGGAFYGPGCSYERRAIAAATRKAAGVLFRGQHHSPFDWDGSSQRGLADSSVALDTEYACIEKAVAELGGEATIQLSPVPTPLSQTWYLALGWAWFAVILAALLVSICVGAWQQWRFWRYGMEMSSRAVVGMEMVMLSMLFIRMLNGPGYDHGWQSLIPHYASRMALSLTFSLHLLAMLLVSKQLRRTQEQVEQRRDAGDVEDEAEGLCTRYGREVHSGFAIFVRARALSASPLMLEGVPLPTDSHAGGLGSFSVSSPSTWRLLSSALPIGKTTCWSASSSSSMCSSWAAWVSTICAPRGRSKGSSAKPRDSLAPPALLHASFSTRGTSSALEFCSCSSLCS